MTRGLTISVYNEYESFHLYASLRDMWGEIDSIIAKAKKYTYPSKFFDPGDFAAAIIRAFKEEPGDICLIHHVEYFTNTECHIDIFKEWDELIIDYMSNE